MSSNERDCGALLRSGCKGDTSPPAGCCIGTWFLHFIEHNFLAGRTFTDLADLNAHARVFCDKVNAARKKHLHASPRELFGAEQAHLRPLPLFVPEVYALHHRLVDVEGFVNVHGHRYSVRDGFRALAHVEGRQCRLKPEEADVLCASLTPFLGNTGVTESWDRVQSGGDS